MADNDFDDPDSFFDRVLKSSSGQSQFWARRSFWGGVLMAVSVLALVAVIWLSYVNAPDSLPEEQLPLIEADTDPLRVAPEDPGGMEIRNADSTIYNAMRGEDDVPVQNVENLFEDETPINRDEALKEAGIDGEAATDDGSAEVESLIEESKIDTPDNEDLEAATSLSENENPEETLEYVRSVLDRKDINTEPQLDAEAEAESKTAMAADTEEAETLKPEEAPIEAPAPTPVPAPVPAPVASAASIPTTGSGPERMVQLGSFRDRSAAQTHWDTINKQFPNLLSGYSLKTQEADLGDKGIYYRVQAGPMPETKAKSICDLIIEKRPGGCLVVRP